MQRASLFSYTLLTGPGNALFAAERINRGHIEMIGDGLVTRNRQADVS